MDIIKLNFKYFLENIKASTGSIFGIIGVILLFIDKEQLKIDSTWKGIGVMAFVILVSTLYGALKVLFYQTVEVVKGKIVLSYGDIWKIAFGKKADKKIVVVGLNSAFDTIVDSNTEAINKPLISPKSLHGQWIERMKAEGLSESEISNKIENSLNVQKIKPIKTLTKDQKTRGNTSIYPLGSVVLASGENSHSESGDFSHFQPN